MTFQQLLAALPLLAIACGGSPETEPAVPPVPVTGQLVTLESIPTTIPVAGTVQAGRRAEIATRLMARVSDVRVDVGTNVRSGQILAVLGREDLTAARARAQAGVEAATAARDEAQRQLDRMEVLFEQDAVPLVQRDGARLSLIQAQSGYAAATAALAEVESQASYSELKSPFNGRVVQRFADPGDIANPGMPLLVVEDIQRSGVVYVGVEVAGSLGSGTRVVVRSGQNRSVTASITHISSGADPATRTVEIRFNLPEDWPTGANITAFISQGTHEGVAIQESLVIRRGQLTGVHIATPSGVQLRWIRLGRTFVGTDDITRFEVLSGLAPGERIAE